MKQSSFPPFQLRWYRIDMPVWLRFSKQHSFQAFGWVVNLKNTRDFLGHSGYLFLGVFGC